ncbi:MAG: Uma2 family endonuclease [Leptolyngbya sp. BL-A-14]
MTAFTINFDAIVQITDEHFEQLCRANPDVKFERTTKGELVIVAPTGGETGSYNFEIAVDFGIWNRQTKLGICFDSSTCFKLPNEALRSPDVAWIKKERWDALTLEQKQKIPPIVPDFVLELMSPSDDLNDAQAKMREYIENGVQLGWLINRKARSVEIYRPNQPVESLDAPAILSGESVLPGFILNLQWL